MSVRIGIGLGQGSWPPDSTGRDFFWDFIDLVEASDIDSIWISDRIVGEHLILEPVVVMAAIAARTRRLKFGPSVLALPLRNPVVLAKEIATLDYLSGGRVLPAVGLGTENEDEFVACGVRKSERSRRVDEAIPLVRRLWTEGHVTHHGTFYHCDNVTIEPKPVQQPPPIWIGGRSEAALRRCGSLGDGWLAAAITPEEAQDGIRRVLHYAEASQREFDLGHIGVILSYYIAESMDEACRLGEPYLVPRRRSDLPMMAFSAFGTPADVCATIQRYVDAGASKFVLRPACSPEHLLEQAQLLAQEIIPGFHRR